MLPVDEFSPDVRPQDDLWGFVNAGWLATDPIPPDRARWGLSDEKRDRISRQLRDLVTTADRRADRVEEQTVARLHGAYLDLDARRRDGIEPIAEELVEISRATDVAALLAVVGRCQRDGVPGLCAVSAQPDVDDPTGWSVHLFQDGLSVPPPAYPRLGPGLSAVAGQLAAGAGLVPGTADRAMDLELALADASWDRPYGDDDLALTNPMSWDELDALVGVSLAAMLDGLGLRGARVLPLNVCQPSYWDGLGVLLRDRPIADWRAWATWRVLCHRAPLLTPELEETHHAFFVQEVRGQPEPSPSWRRAVELVQEHCGTALGRMYVEHHLEESAKVATRELAELVRDQLRRTLLGCDWMSPATRVTAVDKLDRVELNIGWPDDWPPTACLDPDAGPVDGVRRLARHASARLAARLAGPVDRRTWGPPPFVVGTFYHPLLNQLTVEGGSLPPVEVTADRAVLLGQYASIIGHELGHAFDSRGSQRDPHGVAREWWSDDERATFDERVARVVAQVEGYRPRGVDDSGPGLDGGLVGFEVVAELVGYQAAWDAYVAATTAEERSAVTDGFTGAQRFFLAKAYGRRAADRPAVAQARLESDVHPPFEVFANLARHLDAFHHAFATGPGDAMWLAPAERVRVF